MNEAEAALERLMARVDRALAAGVDADELRDIQRHLDECGACATEVQRAQLIRRLLQSSCQREAPDHLRERVRMSSREVSITQRADGSIAEYREVQVSVRRTEL